MIIVFDMVTGEVAVNGRPETSDRSAPCERSEMPAPAPRLQAVATETGDRSTPRLPAWLATLLVD
jgi:hypothetical protein